MICDLDTKMWSDPAELRRARKRFEGIMKNHRESIYKRDHHSCQKCGYSPVKHKLKHTVFNNQIYSPPHLEIDHIVPLSKGGTNQFKNLQTLCSKCNSFKALNVGNDSWNFKPKHVRYMNILGYDIEKKELVNG